VGVGEFITGVFRCGILLLAGWTGGGAGRVGCCSGLAGGSATGSVSALLGTGACSGFVGFIVSGSECVRGGPGGGETGERSWALGMIMSVGIAP
jgi:hypothetical protein